MGTTVSDDERLASPPTHALQSQPVGISDSEADVMNARHSTLHEIKVWADHQQPDAWMRSEHLDPHEVVALVTELEHEYAAHADELGDEALAAILSLAMQIGWIAGKARASQP